MAQRHAAHGLQSGVAAGFGAGFGGLGCLGLRGAMATSVVSKRTRV